MSKRRTFSDLVDVNVRNFEYDFDETKDDFDALVSDFIAYTTANNVSSETVRFYRERLSVWRNRLDQAGKSTDVRSLDAELLRWYIDYNVNTLGLRYSSVATTLRGVKAFANYLRKQGVIESHGFDEVQLRSGGHRPIQAFSEDDVKRLLAQPDPKLFVGVRNYTIILTLLETGIRLRELCDLRLADVDFDDRVLKVFGKNQNFRYVPFQAHFAKVLRQYLKVRGKSVSDALFITHDDVPIKNRTVQEMLRKYGKAANITEVRVSPHTFRHTFAKWYIKNGGDPFSLQKILGHSTMEMVRHYVNIYGKELDEAHRKFSPLNNLFR